MTTDTPTPYVPPDGVILTTMSEARRIAHEQALPAADQIVIIAHMAAIRAEHMRTAVGLVGGSEALADLLDRTVSLPQPALNTVDGTEKNDPGTAQTARGLATTEKESRHD